MKIDLQNFCLKNDNGNFKIEINPDVEIPDNLYKYYYLNRNSLNVLKENILHFSHSFTMNDIMDGSFLLWDMEKFVDDLMIRHNIPKQKSVQLKIHYSAIFGRIFKTLRYILCL